MLTYIALFAASWLCMKLAVIVWEAVAYWRLPDERWFPLEDIGRCGNVSQNCDEDRLDELRRAIAAQDAGHLALPEPMQSYACRRDPWVEALERCCGAMAGLDQPGRDWVLSALLNRYSPVPEAKPVPSPAALATMEDYLRRVGG